MARCWVCVWRGVLMVVVFCFSCCRPQGPARDGKFIRTHLLEGTSNVHVVECTDRDIVAMNISYAGEPLISVDMRKQGTCKTSRGLAACVLKDGLVTAKVLVTDLEEGQTREYGCRISKFPPHGQETVTTEYYVNVTKPIATTTEGTTSRSRTSAGDKSTNSMQTGDAPESAFLPNSVIYVGLVLLILLIVACLLLAVKFFRERRKERECEGMSGTGVMGQTFTFSRDPDHCGLNPSASTSPYRAAQQAPGFSPHPTGNQYQTSAVDSQSLAGAQYQAPWGHTLDDPEVLSMMSTLRRPNPHLVKVPDFDVASSASQAPVSPTDTSSSALVQNKHTNYLYEPAQYQEPWGGTFAIRQHGNQPVANMAPVSPPVTAPYLNTSLETTPIEERASSPWEGGEESSVCDDKQSA